MGNPKHTADRLSWSHFKDIIGREKNSANEALCKMIAESSGQGIRSLRDLIARERTCRKSVDRAARHWAARLHLPNFASPREFLPGGPGVPQFTAHFLRPEVQTGY